MITENTKKWTVNRVLVIEYDGDGRYHEILFSRTVLYNAFPAYIDPAGRKFNENLLTCRSKAYPIPDDAKLYRWVLRDGTVAPPPMSSRNPIVHTFTRSMGATCTFPSRTSPT